MIAARPIVRGLAVSAIATCPSVKQRLERIRTATAAGIITPAEADAMRADARAAA